jgi:hypothetical protein
MPESQEKKILNIWLQSAEAPRLWLYTNISKHNHTRVNDDIAPLHFIVGLCLCM